MPTAPLRHRSPRDRGQAVVEFALVLPFVALLVLGIVQLVVVARDQLTVEFAAREGARAAVVAADPGAAATLAATAAVRLDPLDVAADLRIGAVGKVVTVTVRYRSPTDVPIIGSFIDEVDLVGRVTMRREPPDG